MRKLTNKGYVLIESLVSLSLISAVLVLFVPFVVTQQERLHEEKNAVTLSRAVYDYVRGHNEQEEILFSVNQSATSEKVTAYDKKNTQHTQTIHLLSVQAFE